MCSHRTLLYHVVSLYNNAGLISKVSEDISREKAENCRCRQPHCRLTPPLPPRISAQTLYRQKLQSLPKICAADSMCLSLLVFTQSFFEVARSEKAKPARKQNLTRNSQYHVEIASHGHSRSHILGSVKSR